MAANLQPTLRQLWRDGYYDECLEVAATVKIGEASLTDFESPDDARALLGHMMKLAVKERENHQLLFQKRTIEEDGDPARLDWLEEDLRRLLAVFQFIRTERVTVREAINWMVGNPQDAELAPEFIAVFDEAMRAKPESVSNV